MAHGRAFKILTISDEYTGECLAIIVDRHITSQDVIDQLFHLFVFRGTPDPTRSDNGPESTAQGQAITGDSGIVAASGFAPCFCRNMERRAE